MLIHLLAALAQAVAPVPPAPVQPAPAAAPAATEVTAIVAREFPAYDKDRDGALSRAEFAEWMVKLKTIADPALKPDAPSTQFWVGAAFAQADADRSKSLTLGEVTGFLVPARS